MAKPIYQMMAAVDTVVENAIRNNTLGQGSPYYGWSVEQFQAQRRNHVSDSRAPVGPKPGPKPPTRCTQGHPRTPANTGRKGQCLKCGREYSKRYEAEHKDRDHNSYHDKIRGYVEPYSNQRDSASHLQDPR